MKKITLICIAILLFAGIKATQAQKVVAKIQLYVGKRPLDVTKALEPQLSLADSTDVKIRIDAEPIDKTATPKTITKPVKPDNTPKPVIKTDKPVAKNDKSVGKPRFEVTQVHVFLRRGGRPIYDKKMSGNIVNVSVIDQDPKVRGFKKGDVLVVEISQVTGLKAEDDEIIDIKRLFLTY